MLKRLGLTLGCLSFCLIALTGCGEETLANGELKIFNWGEYISDGTDGSMDVIAEFEQETGIQVTAYDTYDSNEQMYAKLKSGSAEYDVIFPSDYMISRLINEDMLVPIDTASMENYYLVDDVYKGSRCGYDPTDSYTVPYTWGTVGIIYNKPLIEQITGEKAEDVVKGWDAFWDPRLDDNLYMFINARDSFGIAEKRLGVSLNETDSKTLELAAALLKAQKPLVQAYVMDEMFDKMENGEAALSPAYAGDIVTMMETNEDLRYCFPQEGSNLFVDAACIPKNAKNKENAEKFIDFLNRPDVALANAEYICYSTPNKGAYGLLDEDLKNNPIAYPPEEILNQCETYLNLPEEATEQMENLWTEVRK